MLDYLNQNPKKVALIGPDDNDLAKTVGAIASLPRYKLLQVCLCHLFLFCCLTACMHDLSAFHALLPKVLQLVMRFFSVQDRKILYFGTYLALVYRL